jgi:uncharacterized peroxidase-related enzyme
MHFPLTKDAEAPREVARVFSDFQHTLGYPGVPNFVRMQGSAPSVLNGTWGLIQNILGHGLLPRSIKEFIWVTIAVNRECNYCEQAHIACCRILGVDERTIELLRQGLKDELPPKIRDILHFATRCANAPHELRDEDFAKLNRHGLVNEEILEVIATASAAVYASIIAEATDIEPDAMFTTPARGSSTGNLHA